MKATLVLLALTVSVSAFAREPRPLDNPFVFTSASPLASMLWSATTSGDYHPKQAAEAALRDVQKLEAGVLSPALNQYIKSTLERHPDQSVADAIDSLVDAANEVLEN